MNPVKLEVVELMGCETSVMQSFRRLVDHVFRRAARPSRRPVASRTSAAMSTGRSLSRIALLASLPISLGLGTPVSSA